MNRMKIREEKKVLDWETQNWLLEEYKILSSHYFHEDDYYLKSVALFATLNTGLLTIISSELIKKGQEIVTIAFSLIGIIASFAWFISLRRVRYLRRKIEARIQEIEINLHSYWKRIENPPPFEILQIREREETTKLWERLPVSLIMLLFPMVFFTIWLVILAKEIF